MTGTFVARVLSRAVVAVDGVEHLLVAVGVLGPDGFYLLVRGRRGWQACRSCQHQTVVRTRRGRILRQSMRLASKFG